MRIPGGTITSVGSSVRLGYTPPIDQSIAAVKHALLYLEDARQSYDDMARVNKGRMKRIRELEAEVARLRGREADVLTALGYPEPMTVGEMIAKKED